MEQLEEESRGGLREARNGDLTNGDVTNGRSNGVTTKCSIVPVMDVAANGRKGVSENGVSV